MSKDEKNNEESAKQDASPAYVSSDADKAKARKWFQRAAELAEGKSWDFAIKCYIDGLAFWPDAVVEAHQPLRAAAAARNLTGGKKPGFTDTVRFPMTGRDAKKAMLNAEWLMSHDPFNISYVEGILKNANKLRVEDTIIWIGPVYFNALEKEKKLSPKRCALLREVYEQAGDRHAERGQADKAIECYERGAEALSIQKLADPNNHALDNELRDLSTKLTILKGKYESADTYMDSMRDAEMQKGLQDAERMIQDDESLKKLIRRAQQDLDNNPENPNKVRKVVELLCSRDDEQDEKRATALLNEKFDKYGDYGYKVQAEDIHIRQMKRAYRKARDAKQTDEARKQQVELLKYEVISFGERVKQYPTDNRLKYELALRLFQSRSFGEAIPHFQAARADAKVRMQSDLYLGRCFFEMKFGAQAVGTLSKAAESYEIPDDRMAKELRYWLGRSFEAEGRASDALNAYGLILQLDYNFRDVRDRLETLRAAEQSGS